MITVKKCYFCYRKFKHRINSDIKYRRCKGCLHNINISKCKNIVSLSNLNYNITNDNPIGYNHFDQNRRVANKIKKTQSNSIKFKYHNSNLNTPLYNQNVQPLYQNNNNESNIIELSRLNIKYKDLINRYDKLSNKYLYQVNRTKFYKKKYKESKEGNKCSVCLLDDRDTAFIPCGHFCCCNNCAKRCNYTCPICRKGANFIQKIYLP